MNIEPIVASLIEKFESSSISCIVYWTRRFKIIIVCLLRKAILRIVVSIISTYRRIVQIGVYIICISFQTIEVFFKGLISALIKIYMLVLGGV